MTEEEKKQSRRNIIIMLILAVAFIIGIATRWEYAKEEIINSVDRYIHPEGEK